jgi:uncharacterized protein (TIGR03086 family)
MSDTRQLRPGLASTLPHVVSAFDGVTDRFRLASELFGQTLAHVQPGQWTWPTPCTEWDVRQLVNHMTAGNLNYIRLLNGATSAEFLQARDADVLGADPDSAFARSVQRCAEAFAQPGALSRLLDHPLGQVTGRQALAVRTADSVIHTWDLARAIGADDILDTGLVGWISDWLDEIYAGLAETPAAAETTHRFFAAPPGVLPNAASRQARLLHRMGRRPDRSF